MVFFVLWFVDGAVAGVGAEPVAEVVGGAKVGGEDGVFFLCLRDEVAVVVALARLPVGEARPGKDAPAVGQVQVGAGVEAGAAVFFAACALVRVVGAGDVAVVGEDVGDRAHGALVERVVVVVVVVVAGADFEFVFASPQRVFAADVEVKVVFFRRVFPVAAGEARCAVVLYGNAADDAVLLFAFTEAVAVLGVKLPVFVEAVVHAGKYFAAAALVV